MKRLSQPPLRFVSLLVVVILGIFSPLQAQETEPVISNLHVDRVTATTARINGVVHPSNSNTKVEFHWGEDGNTFPNVIQIAPNFVDLNTATTVRANLADLMPGDIYHFRIVAQNDTGPTISESYSFRTLSPPSATITKTEALTTTRALVTGVVDPNGGLVNVSFEYGTNGVDFTSSAIPIPSDVSGDLPVEVAATLTGLIQGTTYYVRIRAQGLGGTALSDNETLNLGILSGLEQGFPNPPPVATSSVTVIFNGVDKAAWRFVGNRTWRESGETVTNLAGGLREMEFLPVAGYVHPLRETVNLQEGEVKTLNRDYFETPTEGIGSLTIHLKPDEITSSGLTKRAQWRFLGEDTWTNSGETRAGLEAGNYEVRFKAVDGRETPQNLELAIAAGDARVVTITYPTAINPVGLPPVLRTFAEVSTNQNKPFAYLGQIRSEDASSTGFVVKNRVVATAGHVVFDDGTLSFNTDIRWFFQRHKDTYEPRQQTPRGFYLANGYDAQRILDNSPGSGTPQSQNLDFAALYFSEEAGRGGHAGYLASDSGDENEFLSSTAPKILAGYPVNVPTSDKAKIHATAEFTQAMMPAFGETWTTTSVYGIGGMSGGALFVRHATGAFIPAAIYLGGSGQTVVRAIDSDVVDLFSRAEVSGNGGDNNSSGGVSHTSIVSGNSQPGALKVIIEPAAARNIGAGWMLSPGSSLRPSQSEATGLPPAIYKVKLKEIPGFLPPVEQQVAVEGGTTTQFIYTYQPQLTLLDTWRFANFGTFDNVGDAADNSDFDKDGETNIEEYIAGTNPKIASDVFKIDSERKSGSTFTVTCAGEEGRKYFLLRSTTLDGTWTRLGSQGPMASDGTVTLSDTSAPPEDTFYRIEVSFP